MGTLLGAGGVLGVEQIEELMSTSQLGDDRNVRDATEARNTTPITHPYLDTLAPQQWTLAPWLGLEMSWSGPEYLFDVS